MKERDQSRLASLLTLVLGIWVLLSPIWVSVTGFALTSVIITGGVIALASIAQFFSENVAPSWVMGVFAVWLVVSALAFTMTDGAVWSQLLSGIATFFLAYWDGFEVAQKHEHHMAT